MATSRKPAKKAGARVRRKLTQDKTGVDTSETSKTYLGKTLSTSERMDRFEKSLSSPPYRHTVAIWNPQTGNVVTVHTDEDYQDVINALKKGNLTPPDPEMKVSFPEAKVQALDTGNLFAEKDPQPKEGVGYIQSMLYRCTIQNGNLMAVTNQINSFIRKLTDRTVDVPDFKLDEKSLVDSSESIGAHTDELLKVLWQQLEILKTVV